jgi:hypothetical protein
VNASKVFTAVAVAIVLLVSAGVAYAANSASEMTPGTTTGKIPSRAASPLRIREDPPCRMWPR